MPITNYYRNADQNYNEIPHHTGPNGHHQKSVNSKSWRGCGEKGTLVQCWWEFKFIQPLWRAVQRFLKKLNIELPCVLITQSCLTLCDSMDWSPPGSSVLGILQARILEWAAISFPGIFPTQGLNPRLSCFLHWEAGSLYWEPYVCVCIHTQTHTHKYINTHVGGISLNVLLLHRNH